jgi:ABC-type phosphate transport system substrate-binding protein
MLHKRHNSVVTLAILLTLVGVSKPAKAFLLAQSDKASTTFAVPDKLPQDAMVKIAASSSTSGIAASLKESFATKYPQAQVKLKTQDSVSALKSLSSGQADLAAIGRVLTAAEKAQGFISVPISREKIAIVVSKNNPFDGNLTIDQFAQIFRGEITDWSEIGGAPGKINLIDAPNSNDTRQAFPSYPVFQSGEFKTGLTANQLKQDSIDAMIAKLGTNGIGYAVANDVIKRDDVKVVTMHQTQPSDPRYPFSEPFNLIYKGTPSAAAQAYLGFATTQGGKQVIANRVGSISAATLTGTATGVVSDLASKKGTTNIPSGQADVNGTKDSAIANGKKTSPEGSGTTANIKNTPNAIANGKKTSPEGSGTTANIKNTPNALANGKKTSPEGSATTANVRNTPNAIAGGADVKTVKDAAQPNAGVNEANKGVIADAKVNSDVQKSGQVNPDVNDSGQVNPDVQKSGQVNPSVNDSGQVNPDVQKSGQVNPGVNDSGQVNPGVNDSGEPLSSKNNANGVNADTEAAAPNATSEPDPGTKVAAKKGSWWWWLLPLLGIPLLAALILGGRKKSDREPAINDISNINNLDGRVSSPDTPGGGDVPPVGANVSTGLGNVAENTANSSSNMGRAGLAAGGAALAGGTAAAANLAGRRNRTENVADPDLDLDLDLDESTTVEEIPSNPVSEFTGQETKLQDSDQPTNLQLDEDDDGFTGQETKLQDSNQPTNLQLDEDNELESVDSQQIDNLSLGGAAAIGGAAAVSRLSDSGNETVIDPVAESPNVIDADIQSETSVSGLTTEQTTDVTELNLDNTVETGSATTEDVTVGKEFSGDFVLQEENRNISVSEETATEIDPNRRDVTSDVTNGDFDLSNSMDTSVDVPNFSQETDLDLGDRVNDFETVDRVNRAVDFPDSVEDVTTPDVDLATDVDPNIDGTGIVDGMTQAGGAAIAGGAAALGGAAAAASGMFNRGESTTEDTELDVPDFSQETDLDLGDRANDFETVDRVNRAVDFPDSVEDATTPDVDLATDVDPNIDGTGIIDSMTQAGGATIAGGAAALGGTAAASGMFNRRDGEQTDDIQEFETFETSFDPSDDNTSTNFADNVIGDAQTTSIDARNSLEGFTLDNLTNQADLNLDDITIDNADSSINTSLEEITFDDATTTENLSFDEISLDDMDSSINGSLEEITFDDETATEDLSFDEIALDDMDSNINASLEEITFDDASGNLSSEEITFEDTKVSNRNIASDEDINLNDLGFENSAEANTNTAEFDLLSDNTAEITSLPDNQSNDLNNISEWLDSLETPNQDSDNISEWLDTLDKDSFNANPNSTQENLNPETTAKEADDISFQFLEDLLDRDSDPNRNNQ